MSPRANQTAVLKTARDLVSAGFAVHWLRPATKIPFAKKWASVPVATYDELKASYRAGYNIGLRTGEPSQTRWGYCHLIDLDIRDESQTQEALGILKTLWSDYDRAPTVISGSGGQSRHIYFFCDKPFKRTTLAKSRNHTLVFDATKGRDVMKYDWEIAVYGTNSQAVLPPSIHPDTKQPYRWLRELDFISFDLGDGPFLDSEVVAEWGALLDAPVKIDEDDLAAFMRSKPMGLSDEEIDKTLSDLPIEWLESRDRWYQVGMALHHEFEGDSKGFDIWSEWSQQSPKYDARDQMIVWKSFKGSKDPIRMATLIKAAGEARDRQFMDELEDLGYDDAGGKKIEGDEDPLDNILDAKAFDLDMETDWKTLLHRNEKGELKSTLHNIRLILENDVRSKDIIGYNEFVHALVLAKPATRQKRLRNKNQPVFQLTGSLWTRPDKGGTHLSDSHYAALRNMIEAPLSQGGFGIKVSDRDLMAAADIVGREMTFHPVREYLESLVWDGVCRIDTLYIDYLHAEDNEYHRSAGRLTCLGAVTRIFEPGHKFDFVPILEGAQGKGKSTFIEILARGWFAELSEDLSDQNRLVEKMQGSWIIEIPELQGFNKHEITTIKAFVSSKEDKVRLAWKKNVAVYKRQVIFIGSTNDRKYLRDMTGNRRFWPVQCGPGMIDNITLRENVDQIWAEAVAVYKAMRKDQISSDLPLYLSNDDARKMAEQLQLERTHETPEQALAGQIEEWLNTPIQTGLLDDETDEPVLRNVISIPQIWHEMLHREGAVDHRHSQLISSALDMIPGWDQGGRIHVKGYGRQRVRIRSEN